MKQHFYSVFTAMLPRSSLIRPEVDTQRPSCDSEFHFLTLPCENTGNLTQNEKFVQWRIDQNYRGKVILVRTGISGIMGPDILVACYRRPRYDATKTSGNVVRFLLKILTLYGLDKGD